MADRTPSYPGLGNNSNVPKSGLTEKDRDKVTEKNPPKRVPSSKGYA